MASKLPQSSVAIRPYQGEVDFPGLVAFIAMQYEHERERQNDGRIHGGKMAPQYANELVDAVETRRGCLLIAEVGEVPVGFIAAYVMSDPDPVLEDRAREHAFVRDLFVLPNWRRMGVATRLVQAAEAHFRSITIPRIRLAGAAQNEAMLCLVVALNFSPYAAVYDRPILQPSHSVQDGKIVKGTR